jgi:hypothetical protein
MTTTSADRVTLILDCLGHLDTDLCGQPRLWRHRDGRYVTEDEAVMIGQSTIGEIKRAMDLWDQELEHMAEQTRLREEFMSLTKHGDPGEAVRQVVSRLPEADRKRAEELWQRIGPAFEAWRQDQP